MLFALLDILIKDLSEIIPTRLRDQDRVAIVSFDLRDGDVPALSVLLASKVKVLVLDPHVTVVGLVGSLLDLAIIVLFNELFQVLVELFHAVGRNKDLEPRVSSRKGLRDLQEATASIFLQINVILLVLLEHDLGLELALVQVVGVDGPHLQVSLDDVDQVLTKLGGRRQGHQDLVLAAIGADLGDLDEPTPSVLLDVQIESEKIVKRLIGLESEIISPFGFQHNGPAGQVSGATGSSSSTPDPFGTGFRSGHDDPLVLLTRQYYSKLLNLTWLQSN